MDSRCCSFDDTLTTIDKHPSLLYHALHDVTFSFLVVVTHCASCSWTLAVVYVHCAPVKAACTHPSAANITRMTWNHAAVAACVFVFVCLSAYGYVQSARWIKSRSGNLMWPSRERGQFFQSLKRLHGHLFTIRPGCLCAPLPLQPQRSLSRLGPSHTHQGYWIKAIKYKSRIHCHNKE